MNGMDICGSRIRVTCLIYTTILHNIGVSCLLFSNVSDTKQLDSNGHKCWNVSVRSPGPTLPLFQAKNKANRVHPQNRWLTQLSFSKSIYSFEVREDTSPGTSVGLVEAVHTEEHETAIYSVMEDDGDGLFLLSPHSGEFLLSRALDFESEQLYILTVAVKHDSRQLARVRVYFNVIDVNDSPPVFTLDTNLVSLPEDTPAGTCFFTLNVTDADDGTNGEVDVSIISEGSDDNFFLNQENILCLREDLDRERKVTYSLIVQATDCPPTDTRLSSTVRITVQVEDLNDNAPLITSAKTVSCAEDSPPRSVVTVIHAVDPDSGSNGNIVYSLETSSRGVFRINSTTGIVYLQEPLDRETEDVLMVTVMVRDQGVPQSSSSMNLTVLIEDVNDHDPEFFQSFYSLDVHEDVLKGTQLLQVNAHDLDTGMNGRVRYKIAQSEFTVDSVLGVVSVSDRLDRETVPFYSLTVTAVDQGDVQRSATATINITILDINDCMPQFSPTSLMIHVFENGKDLSQTILQVTAVDEDLGMNSQLAHFIERVDEGEDGLFSIHPNGTFQILHDLNREEKDWHMVMLTAVDSGLPPLTGTGTILISVDDINDNRPLFSASTLNAYVLEDAPLGTVFATLNATDKDAGVNAQIRYSLLEVNTPFSISETSGEMFISGTLDRETVTMYHLTVVASDANPTHPLSSSATVSVHVRDVNDQRPRFLYGPYVAHVPAEMSAGSVVCAVIAEDADEGSNAQLRFSLHGPNADLFNINSFHGTVFTSDSLNGNDDITISVHAKDGGQRPQMDTTTLTVRFQNISDFPSIRVQVHTDTVSEDVPPGTLVAMVTGESRRNSPVFFYLASGNFGDAFDLHQRTGKLTVKSPLDFETNTNFSLLVEARDSGSPPFSSYAEVRLRVFDVNDNYPVFTQEEYRCEVFENGPESRMCDVLANDYDSGLYGEVEYKILAGNIDDAFSVDLNHGVLTTKKSLDRERIPHYTLTVEARDKGSDNHTAVAVVLVTVLDTNDHAPRFFQIFLTEIPEDTPVGSTVLYIASVDEDIGVNAIITYAIIDQGDRLPFRIDKNSGIIVVEQCLDRENQDLYVIKVNANDSAWGISTDVTIQITDINDNRPEFSQPFYSVTVTETEAQEVFLLKVKAMDNDLGLNAQIVYFIEQTHEIFIVTAFTGDISTKRSVSLNEAESQSFNFTVIAIDCGLVPLNNSATVSVTFVRYNHFPPSFLPHRSQLYLPLTLAVCTEVLQLLAVDQDVPHKDNSIDYMVSGGNASLYFEVEITGGAVLLSRPLRESQNNYLTLLVTAKDKGFPPLSAQTEISIEITQENQFAPHFSRHFVSFFVPEDLSLGSVIGKVEAKDEDDGINGLITYSFRGGNEDGLFSMRSNSGLIMLVEHLDFEKTEVHDLQIMALDEGWMAKTGIINVTISVADVNDNAPVFISAEYVVSFPENSLIGSSVFQVKASDKDSGINAQIFYSVMSRHVDMFAVDSVNGTITSLEVFDFEQQQSFKVSVKALNIGNQHLHDVCHIHIQITGVNEYIPVFERHLYNFSLSENLPISTKVGKVVVTDNDFGLDGQVFYLLVGLSKWAGFDIDKQSGMICTSRELKNQDQGHAVLHVLAKNSGSITGFDVDEAIVHVYVIDENDPPEFHSKLYTVAVLEDVSIGTSVTRVNAIDQDVALEWNRFSYSIESGNDNFSFRIDPVSGVISVNSHLDREHCLFYNLTVTAKDEGSPPATGSTNVIITIIDVNDNAPRLVFTEGYVRENQPRGTLVATLIASDDDLPPNQGPFMYWLTWSDAGNSFSLTSDGILFTSRPLDREQNPLIPVHVVVQDAGTPPLSSTVLFYVKVLDENDNPPTQRIINIEVKYYGSAFPGGVIGNVRPEDKDESDLFNCSIRNVPDKMFSFPFRMCELWSSPYQGEATYNITVEANDQFHPSVNNSVYVSYKGFTNSSLDNCVLFYISSSTLEEFLSLKYLKFVKALDSLFNLQASKTHVFGMKLQGDKILLLADVKSYNGQHLSGELASGISGMHKRLLEAQSNVTISQITSDPCFLNPCQNGATCRKNIHISSDVAVLESLALIFVSPQYAEIFNCSCPAGFTGSVCESDINECMHDHPCENAGTCHNTPGGFLCHCMVGFSGPHCSALEDKCQTVICQNGGTCWNMQGGFLCDCSPGYKGIFCDIAVDHCASSPCLHGYCSNVLTGYKCHCPFGVSGIACEENSYGFEELSYMEFPSLNPSHNLITMDFATVQQSSLLLYNPGDPTSLEFLAVEIVRGRLSLSYDLGVGTVRVETDKPVADGTFHSITVRRNGTMASLEVDSCSAHEPKGFCFAQNEDIGTQRFLDIGTMPMMLGGVRNIDVILERPSQVRTHNFVGCMRNVTVNNVTLNASKALASYKLLERCPRSDFTPCTSDACLNGGICHDHWSFHYCQCADNFTGAHCGTEISEKHALPLDGEAYIEFVIKESYRRAQLLRAALDGTHGNIQKFHIIEVKIKTVRKDSVLMLCFGGAAHIKLKVFEGTPLFVVTNISTGQQSELRVDQSVADGHWHVLLLKTDRLRTIFLLDEHPVTSSTNATINHILLNLDTIVLGAGQPQDTPETPGFLGCIEYVRYDGHVLPFSGFSEIAEVRPSPSLVQNSCFSSEHCVLTPCLKKDLASDTCLFFTCQNYSNCGTSSTINSVCICLRNVTDAVCDSCWPMEENNECSETKRSTFVWIVVVVPLTFILFMLGLYIVLKRQAKRRQNKKDSVQQTKEYRVDNMAFSFDNVDCIHQDISDIGNIQANFTATSGSLCAENCYGVASPMPFAGSELEHYEIDKIDLALPPDAAFSLPGPVYSINSESIHLRGKVVKQSDLTYPVSSMKRDQDQQQGSKPTNPDCSQNRKWNHWRTFMGADRHHECDETPLHLCSKKILMPDLIEPPENLSVDEVRRLKTTLDQNKYLCQAHTMQPLRLVCSARITETSSESESNSPFTYSEYECERELSHISVQGFWHEPTSRGKAPNWSKKECCQTTPSFKDVTPAQDQRQLNSTYSAGLQQWESLLNLQVRFDTYADMFEDIACLPAEPQQDCGLQSAVEEII